MKGIFQLALLAAPLAALVLFFSQMRTEEIKVEQRLQQAVQQLENEQFDQSFSDAWSGRPSSSVRAARAQKIDSLKDEVASAKEKRSELDQIFVEDAADMRSAIRDEDARLAQSKKLQGGNHVQNQ